MRLNETHRHLENNFGYLWVFGITWDNVQSTTQSNSCFIHYISSF